MKVFLSADVLRLEERIIECVARRPRGGLLDPILILVPTRRLGTRLKRQIARRLRAVLGVHILTHRGLVHRVLDGACVAPLRVLSRTARESIVEGLTRDLTGQAGDHLRAFQGARSAIVETLDELRQAGVGAGDLEGVEGSRGEASGLLAGLLRRYSLAVERLEASGWTDNAGLQRAALPHLRPWLRQKGIRSVIHHGSYELVGRHLDLVREAALEVETEVHVPAGASGAAFAYAGRLVERLGGEVEAAPTLQEPARAEWMERIACLYTPESSRPSRDPDLAPRLEIVCTQGAETELRVAALRALALHAREKIPLEEIAIVARTLEPYASFLEPVLESLSIPFTSSASLPQTREPEVASFLTLVRVLARGLERSVVMDLMRDRRIRVGASPPLPGDVDSWDRWSRAARTGSGIDEWRELGGERTDKKVVPTADAPDPEERRRDSPRRESVTRLLVLLEELEVERLRWSGAATLEDHAAFLKDLVRRRLVAGPEGEPAREDAGSAVAELIEEVRIAHLAQVAARGAREGPEAPIAPDFVEDFLQRAAASSPRPIHGEDEGGLRVLDLMQARGLVHRAVIWIGFQGELFPRKASPDPFLGEAERARLAAAGFLVRSRLEASSEERILLAMTLASATERLVISFERADSDGRKRGRSSALREVARVFLGRPDASALLEAAPGNPWTPESVPAHPSQQALHLAGSPRWGLLPRAAAVAGAAAGARNGVAAARTLLFALGWSEPERFAALDHVEAVERFSGGAGPHDGSTGIGLDPARRFSPTSIERLLTCPQTFFLRDVLRVHEIEEEVVPHRLSPLVLGRAAHAALCAVYADLGARGHFTRPDARPEEGLELVDFHWKREVAREAGPSTRRLRALFAILTDAWRRALRRFVELDLAALKGSGSIVQQTEGQFEAGIDFAPDITLPLGGYVDRLVESGGRLLVEDYKTGARLEEKAKPTQILQGLHVQLPLYREILARHFGREPLSIEAAFLALRPDMKEADRRVPIGCEPEVLAGFRESVAVAWKLAMAGLFPLHRDNDGTGANAGYCGHCAYRRTCRRTHLPTVERLGSDARLRDMRDIRKKRWGRISQRLPTLSAVRERAAGEEMGEVEGEDE